MNNTTPTPESFDIAIIGGSLAGTAPSLVLPGDDPGDPFRMLAGLSRVQERSNAASFATVHFRNELGKTLTLVEANFVMDGQELPAIKGLKENEDVVIFEGRVKPGHHIVKTTVSCQGNRRGLITYMKGYKLTVTSEQVLTVPENRAIVFRLAAHRSRTPNVPFEKQIEITARAEVVPGGEALTN